MKAVTDHIGLGIGIPGHGDRIAGGVDRQYGPSGSEQDQGRRQSASLAG
jgi:hypothetical protein